MHALWETKKQALRPKQLSKGGQMSEKPGSEIPQTKKFCHTPGRKNGLYDKMEKKGGPD